MDRCITDMGCIMSGVLIYQGKARRREERRSGCQTDPVTELVTDEGGLPSGMAGWADNTSARS